MIGVLKHMAACCRRLSRWPTFPSAHKGSPWVQPLCGVMSGELTLLLTPRLFACAFQQNLPPVPETSQQRTAASWLLALGVGAHWDAETNLLQEHRYSLCCVLPKRQMRPKFSSFSGKTRDTISGTSICPAVAQNYAGVSVTHHKTALLSGNFSSSWSHEAPPRPFTQ